MLIKMKGTNGQVQTVSIIDTISELASNHGDRAKITQVSKVSSRTSSSSPGTVTSPGGPKFPPPPPPLNPRHPVMSVPPTFLATNISISQMSLPPHNTGVSGTSSMSTILHNSNSSRHKSLMTPTSSGSRHSGNFDDFSSGLNKSGYLNSTMNDMADRRQRRRKKVRNIKTGVRGQGETPDWIKELFNFAKKGNLEKLKESLSDMERALVRNLSDHLGNNLVHVVARHGHVSLLPWLASRLGPELESSLSDENKQGLTPISLAIKHGRQDLVCWLVLNTRDRDRLSSSNGERCLLHTAARYGQDGISGWLCEEMSREGLEVDQMDVSGNTPLHLAARSGNTKTASTLLNLGASVNMKNDMGLKPSDCAMIRGKESTAEFLMMFETALGITKELLHKEKSQETLTMESSDMKTNFKDVLSVSKKLAKEREDMCRDLSKLHESMIELHDKMIMEIQILAQENTSLRKNGVNMEDNSVQLDATIEQCDNLHNRWQHHQKQYFSSSLADMEHRILLAEDSLKKHKVPQPHITEVEQSYAHRNLRDRLEEVRVHASSLASNGGARKLSPTCTSESVTSCDESDDDPDDIDSFHNHSEADTNFYEAMRTPTSSSRISNNIAQRKKLATPSPVKSKNSSDPNMNESMYSSLSSPMYSTIGSPDKKHSSVHDFSALGAGADFSESFQKQLGLDYNSAKMAASEIARSGGPMIGGSSTPIRSSGGSKEDRRRSRTDLKKRLKQLALTSETGSASVIEVIEPNSSEEEEFKKSMQEMNFSWGKGLSLSQAEPQTPMARSKRISADPQPSPAPSSRTSKTSDSSSSSVRGSRIFSGEAGKFRHLSDGRTSINELSSGRPKNLLRSEPDILAGVRDVGQDMSTDSIDIDKLAAEEEALDDNDFLTDDFGDEFYNDDLQMLPYDLESERCDSSLQMKKKGFLQKLSISKWAQKKKSSKTAMSGTKVKEIPPEYFRETYLTTRGGDNVSCNGPGVSQQRSTGKSMEMESSTMEQIKHNQPPPPPPTFTASLGQRSDPTVPDSKRSGVTTITVGHDADGRDDITADVGDNNRLTKSLSPTTRKSGPHHPQSNKIVTEGMSVATSDDSGIIARPMSSASKSETSLSRPDSSSSDQPIRQGYQERVSPIGSEPTKIESSSTPNSGDYSNKLGKIEENPATTNSSTSPMTTIITLKSTNINNNNGRAVRKSSTVKSRHGKQSKAEEKPWYDVSDEDVEIQSPDHITSIISVRGSSDEDPF